MERTLNISCFGLFGGEIDRVPSTVARTTRPTVFIAILLICNTRETGEKAKKL